MGVISFFLVNLMVCSDVILISGFLKHCSTAVNPSYSAMAKKQIISGFVMNVFATHTLLIIHLSKGINLSSYSSFEWALLIISLLSLILFVLCLLGIRITNRLFAEANRFVAVESILLVCIVSAVGVSMISFQMFLGCITL